MLEAIQKFSDSEVFSVTLENEPEKTKHWFRATDLCDVLFSKNNSHKYVTTHCKDWQYREFQVGNGRPALYVCESGVYRLVLRSKAPIAIEFQDWLTEDVLPKLRASGGYIMPTATSEQLEALQAEISSLQIKIELLESGNFEQNLIEQFLLRNVQYKSGKNVMSGCLYKRFLLWTDTALNKDVFFTRLDEVLKANKLPKTRRIHIDKNNGCGDIENAELLSPVKMNKFMGTTANLLGE
jgi:prophage antirepressor-like protein